MRNLISDLKFAIRSLRLAPGFTIVALLVLALGVGATTAIFSVVDAVVLKGLPYEDEGRLVVVAETNLASGRPGSVAPQNFLDWQVRQGGVFEAMGVNYRSDLRPTDPALKDVRISGVTHGLLDALRARVQLGRTLTADDEVAGNERVVLISDALWTRQFNRDPSVIGRTIASENGPWRIVGVTAPTFRYPVSQPVDEIALTPWVVPASDRERNGPGRAYYLIVLARLAPGVTIEQARARMTDVTRALTAEYPTWFKERGVTVLPAREYLAGDMRAPMLMLLGAVALVLLVACANVANLVLVRATTRARELAIRSALGASRWALTRALIVEGLLLSVAGTLLGGLLAWGSLRIVRAMLPPTIFRLWAIAINERVLFAAGAVAVTVGVVFGLAPAWQYTRPRLAAMLSQSASGATSGTARRRLRSALLVAEVALALVLVTGASLFLVSFARVMRIDLGFDYRPVVSTSVLATLRSGPGVDAAAERLRGAVVVKEAREKLAALPGVESAAIMMSGSLPLSGGSSSTSLAIVGRDPLPPPLNSVEVKLVSPEFFETMGIARLRGQGFDSPDPIASGPGAVILSELAVKRFFGSDDPIGARVFTWNGGDQVVVGVVRSTRGKGPESDAVPEVYLPLSPQYGYRATLIARLRPGATLTPAELERQVNAFGGLTASRARALASSFDDVIKPRKLNTVLVAVFGILALVIAATGVYGVMAYVVGQRRREIGLRMALGCAPNRALGEVLREAGGILAVGTAMGAVAAFLLARFAEAFLFGVDAHNPWLFLAAAGVLALAGLLAAVVPARRASRVDPAIALRVQ